MISSRSTERLPSSIVSPGWKSSRWRVCMVSRFADSFQQSRYSADCVLLKKTVETAKVAAAKVPSGMIEGMVDAPVLLLVAVDLRVLASFDSTLPRVGVISGASIYPFVWNILLAARNEGLGGTLTTFLAPAEAEVRK